MGFGGPEGLSPPTQSTPDLEVWAAQIQSEFKKLHETVPTHTHDTADIITGTFVDARIAESNVTQHEAALTLIATQVTSGVFADARIQESNVTQHEAALAILFSQVTGTVPVAQGGTDLTTLTGTGRLIQSTGVTSFGLLDSGAVNGYLRSDGSNWLRVTGLAAADLTGSIADARVQASNVTQHEAALAIAASQITAGTFDTGSYVFPAALDVTTIIEAGDGAVGTPAYSFISDPDLGVYRIGANVLGLAAGGVEHLRIDNIDANEGFVEVDNAQVGVQWVNHTGSTGALTIDFNEGNQHHTNNGGARTFTLVDGRDGFSYIVTIEVVNNAGVITWAATSTTIEWAGNSVPVATTTPTGSRDSFYFVKSDGVFLGSSLLDHR